MAVLSSKEKEKKQKKEDSLLRGGHAVCTHSLARCFFPADADWLEQLTWIIFFQTIFEFAAPCSRRRPHSHSHISHQGQAPSSSPPSNIKMKSAVMAIACAAGANAFVAPR